jgi:hypothetical protein
MHDLRLAIRALRMAPLVSVAAIVSLTLGIGANTAVFSVVNAVLLKPAPYPEPDRLILLGYTFSGASVPLVSETKLNVWKEQTTAWQDIAAVRARRVNVRNSSDAEQVLALQTNPPDAIAELFEEPARHLYGEPCLAAAPSPGQGQQSVAFEQTPHLFDLASTSDKARELCWQVVTPMVADGNSSEVDLRLLEMPQIREQLPRRCVPVGDFLGEAFENDSFQRVWNLAVDGDHPFRLGVQNLAHRLDCRDAGERTPTRRQFIESHAEAEEIAPVVHLAAQDLLRTHVRR